MTVPTGDNDPNNNAEHYHLLAASDDDISDSSSEALSVVPLPPPATATVVVEVVAPANLPGNYRFSAETADGQTVMVTVPVGGVVQGDLIAVNIPTARVTDAVAVEAEAILGDEEEGLLVQDYERNDIIPTGAWRDDLCGCCNHGCCHPHLCMSACGFTPILLAQVMYRMRLNWYGSGPTNSEFQRNVTFYLVTFLFWSLVILPAAWAIWGANRLSMCQDDCSPLMEESASWIPGVACMVIALYFFILTCRTRRAIRHQFRIRETTCCCCRGCEDFCCTYWCTGLTVMQMARHTADYETYTASCCSKTGVAARHPPVVVV